MKAIKRLSQPFSPGLVSDGITHTPPTSLTALLANYQNRKYGWQLNLNMNQVWGFFPDLVTMATQTINGLPPAPEKFDVANVNVAQIIDAGEARGVDFYGITAFNEYGFPLWGSKVPLPPKQPNGYPYHAGTGPRAGIGDTNIMAKLVAHTGRVGKPLYAYFNLGWAFNLWPGNMDLIPEPYRSQVWNYHLLLIQELYTMGVKWFWLDSGATNPAGRTQRYFDAICALGPDALCIINDAGDAGRTSWPGHVFTTEEYVALNPANPNQNTWKQEFYQKNGQTYYGAASLICTGRGQFSEWYLTNENTPHPRLPGQVTDYTPANYQINLFQTDAEAQSLINMARAEGKPIDCCMPLDRHGNMHDLTLAFLDRLNFS